MIRFIFLVIFQEVEKSFLNQIQLVMMEYRIKMRQGWIVVEFVRQIPSRNQSLRPIQNHNR